MRIFPLCILLVAFCFLPGLMPGALAHAPQAASQVPVVVDTATVEITLPEGSPECVMVTVSQDTLGFGEPGVLGLEFADDTFEPLAEDLKTSSPWLKLSQGPDDSPAQQVVYGIHAYRLNPFRIKVGQVTSPVIIVARSTSDLSETAAIRMPRIWATRWWMLVLPALLITAIIMGLWWLWKRRTRLDPLQQWAPAAPAWLQAAIDLRKLLEDHYPDMSTSRHFLDQLAIITRSYLAHRYLVHASEMTSGEILASCLLRGHDNRSLRRMTKILQDLDHNRYDPQPPVVSWCLSQTGALVDAMNDVRIQPRYTHVEASLMVEAEKAWSWLLLPENRPLETASATGGTE